MAKSDIRQHLDNAYQRHIDAGKAIGGILMVLGVILLGIVHFFVDIYNEARLYYIFAGLGGLALGFIIYVWFLSRQEQADTVNRRLYAVWHYKPSVIYSFQKLQSRHTKPVRFYNGLITAGVLLVVTLLLRLSDTTFNMGYISLVGAGIALLYALFAHPMGQFLLLKFRTALLGDAKEIIFSRSGIWYCGKLYYFGKMGITYHRAERREYHGSDAIVFYYTRTRGYQATAMELWVPVAPKMAFAADALIEEFNRSDILSAKGQ